MTIPSPFTYSSSPVSKQFSLWFMSASAAIADPLLRQASACGPATRHINFVTNSHEYCELATDNMSTAVRCRQHATRQPPRGRGDQNVPLSWPHMASPGSRFVTSIREDYAMGTRPVLTFMKGAPT
jgi:hypothetical protein